MDEMIPMADAPEGEGRFVESIARGDTQGDVVSLDADGHPVVVEYPSALDGQDTDHEHAT